MQSKPKIMSQENHQCTPPSAKRRKILDDVNPTTLIQAKACGSPGAAVSPSTTHASLAPSTAQIQDSDSTVKEDDKAKIVRLRQMVMDLTEQMRDEGGTVYAYLCWRCDLLCICDTESCTLPSQAPTDCPLWESCEASMCPGCAIHDHASRACPAHR